MGVQVVVLAANGDILQRMGKMTLEWGYFNLWNLVNPIAGLIDLHLRPLLSQLYDRRTLSAFVVGRF
jgi:hypothetical protein